MTEWMALKTYQTLGTSLGASVSSQDWPSLTPGTLTCPPGSVCVPVSFSPRADCQVLKVIPPSRDSQISSPFHPRINTRYIQAGVSRCGMATTTQSCGAVMHLSSSHDKSSWRWSVSCQNCLEKWRAVLSLLCSTLHGENNNLVSVFTLPSLYMYLAHLICLLSVNNMNDPRFPPSHTSHLNTPRKHQIFNCEWSVLWEIH